MKIDFRDKKIGLVLSGGGAKGAYQVGMFRAFEELGIAKSITAYSGCSIGAYAAVIYSLCGYEAYRNFLLDFDNMTMSGNTLPEDSVTKAQAAVKSDSVTKEMFISERKFWRYEPVALYDYFRNLLSSNPIKTRSLDITVCDYSIEENKPIYFNLAELSVEEQVNAIIGSGSLQYLFPPAFVKGHHCLDGGAVPDICTYPAAKDKIPLLPLVSSDADIIFINFLIAIDYVDLSLIPRTKKYIELRPSTLLESYPGSGTLDFSPEKLKEHEEKGYIDTLKLFIENCIL